MTSRQLTLFAAARPPAETIEIGLDEAGRGCLFGPVVAGAVWLRSGQSGRSSHSETDFRGLADSKKLTPETRERLAIEIRAKAAGWGLGVVWPEAIDRMNILAASLEAMRRATRSLVARAELAGEIAADPWRVSVLVDGDKTVPGLKLPQQAIIGGDGSTPVISAASILAKTFRDRLAEALDRRHPGYGIARHKGYGTAEHLEALERLGPCRLHRMSYAPVRKAAARREVAGPGAPDGSER